MLQLRGGQPGHERKLREALPPKRVGKVIEYEIADSDIELLGLTPTDKLETIHHLELPDSPVIVTEHQFRPYETSAATSPPYATEVQGQPLFGLRPRASDIRNLLRLNAVNGYFETKLLTCPSELASSRLR